MKLLFEHVARMLQAAALIWATAVGIVVFAFWPWQPALALVAGLAVAAVHGLVLALEFLLIPWAARQDAVPRAGFLTLVQAWAAELVQGWRVFAWRQSFRWRDLPDQLVPPGETGCRPGEGQRRRGVVLVHGFMCNRGFWGPWLRRLSSDGRTVVAVNLEPPFSSIDRYLPALEDAVARVQRVTGRPPLLVCHSMGGLVARAWLAAYASDDKPIAGKVDHVVTIGSPHAGTWLARFSRACNGRQMRIGSAWLQQLDIAWRAAASSGLPQRFTCWYSNADNIVMPSSNAMLSGADNRLLKGAAHLDMAFHHEVMAHAIALLDRPD